MILVWLSKLYCSKFISILFYFIYTRRVLYYIIKRSRAHFVKEVRVTSAVIQAAIEHRGGVGAPSHDESACSANETLLQTYFTRALGLERLHEVQRAIGDYTRCVKLDPNCAPAFFNRGGLHYAQVSILCSFDSCGVLYICYLINGHKLN